MHLSVFRTGNYFDAADSSAMQVGLRPWGRDDYSFSPARGNETTYNQWDHLEIPLGELPHAAVDGALITSIVLVGELGQYSGLTGETSPRQPRSVRR